MFCIFVCYIFVKKIEHLSAFEPIERKPQIFDVYQYYREWVVRFRYRITDNSTLFMVF